MIRNFTLQRGHRVLLAALLGLQLTGCSDDEQRASKNIGTVAETPDSCGQNQLTVTTGDLYYPGPKCEHVSRNLDFEKFLQKNIQLCQEKADASHPGVSVARVQISSCDPADGRPGIVYSKQICCDVPTVGLRPKPPGPAARKVIAYDANLSCPENQLQALASNLHMPGKSCDQAVAAAENEPQESAHYQKACQAGAKNTGYRQQISDAAAFTCNPDGSGAYLDVVLCCSAILPKGKKMHPLEVPTDIWEVIRTGDLFALQLVLSREPGRANEKGEHNISPLHLATSVAMVDALLAKKARRDEKDDYGFTPLHSAVQRQQHNIVAHLLERGAKIDSVSNSGSTPLSFVKTRKTAALLLAKNANVNGASPLTTPLHGAAFYGRTDVAELLIEHSADINRANKIGETPLHEAAFGYSKTSIDVVRLLISEGANINAMSKSAPPQTPLDKAKKEEIANLIRSHGGQKAAR